MKQFLIITGMHRSGTSFLARALNLYGVFLGDFGSIRNHEWNYHWDNPRGNWENKKLLDLSEETLEINGGSWDNIPNKISIDKKMGDQISEEIKKLSDNSILAAGFKAPQIIFCFDSWVKYFPENFIVIGIIRNPLKVAESLKIRNNFDYKKSLHLWKIYNQKLYETLQKHDGFLLDFDWSKQKLLEEIKLISNKLGLAKNIDLSSWYTEDLFRSDKTFKSDYILSEEIQSLYSKLKDRSNNNNRVHINTITRTNDELEITVNNLLNDIQKQSQFFKSLRSELESQGEFFKSLKKEITNNPISILMNLYNARNDLKQSFPEAQNGNLTRLVSWAVEVIKGSKSEDETIAKELLLKFSDWYTSYLSYIEKEVEIQKPISSLKDENDLLKSQITPLKDENDLLKSQITPLKDDKERFKNEVENHRKNIVKLNQEISNYALEHSTQKRDYKLLKDELVRYQQALDDIKSGIGFKIIRFYATKIEKIRKVTTTFNVSMKFIKKNGLGTFLQQAQIKIKKGEFTLTTTQSQQTTNNIDTSLPLQEQISAIAPFKLFSLIPPAKIPMTIRENIPNRNEHRTNYTELSEDQIYEKYYKVSVVIPTNSNENDLNYLLSKINLQKHMTDLEIILVNSGTHNLNSLQKQSNVKLINIKLEEFNHGTTRNLGASKAIGDYILFLSDDAIPSSDNLFYDLCEELSKNPKCGCVSARQIPKSGTDLMFISGITNHYKFLEHFSTKVKPNSFDRLTLEQKRSVAQIDDVCACYRKSVFTKYLYTDLGYGEDLEMGIKLVKDGYYISNFGRASVIHSHNRPAYYWLKRAFTESTICNPLLGVNILEFKKLYNISTEMEFLSTILSIYNSIGLTIDFLKKNELRDIHQTFVNIHERSLKFFFYTEKSKSSDPSIESFFKIIFKTLTDTRSNKNLLLENYLGRLYTIENFMIGSYPSMVNVQSELFDALYKIFGMFMGEMLSSFMMYSKKYNLEIKQLPHIEKILKGGV